jgi:SAM-dependent methyltransferase
MAPRKIQFACGANRLLGWENYDRDVDLRKPLPIADGVVTLIFIEHGLEHLYQREAWSFLCECHRILKSGGVIRVCVPSVEKIRTTGAPNHLANIRRHGWGDGSLSSAIRACVLGHEHQSLWTAGLLIAVLDAVGFRAFEAQPFISTVPEMQDIDRHWTSYGLPQEEAKLAYAEHTIAVEAVKLL